MVPPLLVSGVGESVPAIQSLPVSADRICLPVLCPQINNVNRPKAGVMNPLIQEGILVNVTFVVSSFVILLQPKLMRIWLRVRLIRNAGGQQISRVAIDHV